MALFNDMSQTDTLSAEDEILLHQGTTDKRISFHDADNLSYASRKGYTYLGDHTTSTSYINLEAFTVYGGRAYWAKSTTSLPYVSTVTNPANDPKLQNEYYKDTIEAEAIAENTADINTNATNIATVMAKANTNTANIVSNDSDITTLRNDVNDNTTNISTNTTNIATNLTKINSNTAGIASNAGKISTLESLYTGGIKRGSFTGAGPSQQYTDVYFDTPFEDNTIPYIVMQTAELPLGKGTFSPDILRVDNFNFTATTLGSGSIIGYVAIGY